MGVIYAGAMDIREKAHTSASDPRYARIESIKGYLDAALKLTHSPVDFSALNDRSLELTHDFLRINSDSLSFGLSSTVIMNITSMRKDAYLEWMDLMVRHYRYVTELVGADHRAEATKLCRIISGIPVIRRRCPELNSENEGALIIASFALFKSPQNLHPKYFFMGTEGVTLKDREFVRFLSSLKQDEYPKLAATISSLVESAGRGSVRTAEVESVFRASGAQAVASGAL